VGGLAKCTPRDGLGVSTTLGNGASGGEGDGVDGVGRGRVRRCQWWYGKWRGYVGRGVGAQQAS
jgi:hypothetical protein